MTTLRRQTPESLAEPSTGDAQHIQRARSLYQIDRWSHGYFDINAAGHVAVRPDPRREVEFDLKHLVDGLVDRGLATPLLLRFSDILRDRLDTLAHVFQNAIDAYGYRGQYRLVYPIKVNQQRHVVEEVLRFGRPHGFGLEAGSKPELMALLALVDDPHTPIVCNGFKDARFIEAVILATKLGRCIIPVVEKFSELQTLIRFAAEHDVQPKIGIRVKLAAAGAGRWHASGGDRSKFGLSISQLLQAVDLLRDHGLLHCLQLLHFHLGSQINDIRSVKSAVAELTRVYAELARTGAGLQYLDVGGGLGVDYDGSQSDQSAGINYSMQEYANDVVHHIMEVCDATGIDHPTIISESGRAVAAHHSVLVVDILGKASFDQDDPPSPRAVGPSPETPLPLRNLYEAKEGLSPNNFVEYYHDAVVARDELLSLFKLGHCTLVQRALGERLFHAIATSVLMITRDLEHVPDEFQGLERMLCDTYFCNCSIFQSLPDAWAIDQLFPIMPIHRLDEPPQRRAILADVTCDSDGRIDRFIGPPDVPEGLPVLPLHDLPGAGTEAEPYLLGVFLVGAYQETLGDLHNLFGDTNAVHIALDEQGQPAIDEVIEGDTVRDVLQYVQWDPGQLRRRFRLTVEAAVRDGGLSVAQARRLSEFYEQGLRGYTYLT